MGHLGKDSVSGHLQNTGTGHLAKCACPTDAYCNANCNHTYRIDWVGCFDCNTGALERSGGYSEAVYDTNCAWTVGSADGTVCAAGEVPGADIPITSINCGVIAAGIWAVQVLPEDGGDTTYRRTAESDCPAGNYTSDGDGCPNMPGVMTLYEV